MIKKFRFFEAKDRMYGGGTLFSNKHRSPNLPDSCPMIDIDGISISASGEIDAIIEDKFKFDSVTLGNPLQGGGTWQRRQLLTICSILKCPLILHETSTGTIIKFTDSLNSEKIDTLNQFNVVSTADKVFVEIRYGRPKSVMFRTEGSKFDSINSDPAFKAACVLTDRMSGVKSGMSLYLVNDVRPEGKIYLRKYLYLDDYEKANPKTWTIDPDSPESWKSVYTKIGLY